MTITSSNMVFHNFTYSIVERRNNDTLTISFKGELKSPFTFFTQLREFVGP